MKKQTKQFIENNQHLLDDVPEELLKHAPVKLFAEVYSILKMAGIIDDYTEKFYLHYTDGESDRYPANVDSFEKAIDRAIKVLADQNITLNIYADAHGSSSSVLTGQRILAPRNYLDEKHSTEDVIFSDGSVYRIHYITGPGKYSYPEYDHHERIK